MTKRTHVTKPEPLDPNDPRLQGPSPERLRAAARFLLARRAERLAREQEAREKGERA